MRKQKTFSGDQSLNLLASGLESRMLSSFVNHSVMTKSRCMFSNRRVMYVCVHDGIDNIVMFKNVMNKVSVVR
jgi:hypothetical protein